MDKLSVVSLFSGVGGFDFGVMRTRQFRMVLQVEKDADACKTLHRNQRTGSVVASDIKSFDFSKIPVQPDVVIGGPPCQSFSAAGKERGLLDSRGQMLWQYIRAIKELQPTVFVMENVLGLTWNGKPKGSVFRQFLRRVPKQYNVRSFIVNAADYGAPQSRKRLIVIGTRCGTPTFVQPTHGNGNKHSHKVLGDVIGDLDPNTSDTEFSARLIKFLALVPPGGNWRSLPLALQKQAMGKAFYSTGGRTSFFRRLSFDSPCPTLLGSPKHTSTPLCHPARTRPLNIREYARIQGFPDSWQFYGSRTKQYLHIGNAVPVALGKAIGRSIKESMAVD